MFLKHSSTFPLLILVSFYCLVQNNQVEALEDGDLYKIIHSSSGNVLTVGSSQPSDGADIIVSPWKNEPNQKWLAVQAVVAGNNYLLMPQQQRWDWSRFLRNGEALRETKERHNDLPDWSLVLNGDNKGQVTQQPRDSKKYQQWLSEVISGSSKVIIKNLQDNKCLQAPGASSSPGSSSFGDGTTTPAPSTSPGFFRRVRNWFGSVFGGGSSSSSSNTATTTVATPTTTRPISTKNTSSNGTTTSTKLTITSCDSSNSGQQWTLEKVSIR